MTSIARTVPPEKAQDPPTLQSAPGPARPRRRGVAGIIQIIAVIAAFALALAYSQDDGATEVAPPSTYSGTQTAAVAPPLVRIVRPERRQTQISLEATGTVQVRSTVSLAPQVGGQVVQVSDSLRAGGIFEAGEVLFTIDPRDYQLALAQTQAELAAAQSRLELRQAEGAAARENYSLLHGDAPVPALVAKVPQIEQSKADLASAEARVARAQLDLSRTEYSLPFAGRVVQTNVSVGQSLNAGQSSGEAFAENAVELVVPVSTNDLASLEPVVGRTAEVRTGNQVHTAMVERRSATLDSRTRFAQLFLGLPSGTNLSPGTFVDVTLMGAALEDTYVLPASAEQPGGSLWLVSSGALTRHEPTVHGRTENGLIVAAFDFSDGIVLGNVPGAAQDMVVTAESVYAAPEQGP